ncbi:C4-dicarboxylate transporter/malic acid transport protein [Lasiodiplodia theobromae]|uniref:Malic acid transport protein n=2 Tax=Lasiodiplodia TaxID=66739 RepID=A0A5N5DPC5_9PEZI|nr:C4-dicarboxylate transporter malic acid transport [Lasiodiplodia theobromae]KAB2579806.1 Malic acid transport protein [Lasiodiplodia theobromae]KAF4542985.1 C4-dicarboxylate transporter malic acid transport [Lasiodiplodia theobromae]KAF9633815.1 C4-dicarboxylate transporter/malic acid transport protein [Lasiodiplodia theobromae]KAK0653211.1 Malic acid transport protein [Lasiodiplodia hormozganensis]
MSSPRFAEPSYGSHPSIPDTGAGIHFDQHLDPNGAYKTDTDGTTTPAYYGASTNGANTPPVPGQDWPDRSRHELTSSNSSQVALHLSQHKLSIDDEKLKMGSDEESIMSNGKVSLRERLSHVTWAWFTTTMSTGGVALVLGAAPFKFEGIEVIGKIIFVFNIVLFFILSMAIAARFAMCPQAFRNSLLDGHEGFFMPCFFLTLSTMINNVQIYLVPGVEEFLESVMRDVFWAYVAFTLTLAVAFYWFIWTTPEINNKLHADKMGPGWMLPIFPIMLSGTLSQTIGAHQPPQDAMPIIVAGIAFQGLGWFVASCCSTIWIYRLFRTGPLLPNVRPAMFMLVGPPSFTALALIGNANALPDNYAYFETHPMAKEILTIVATWIAIFLWALALWFFCIAVVACLTAIPTMSFAVPWWAFVFPNVGFTVATIKIGTELESDAILWLGTVMIIMLAVMWLFVGAAQIRAIHLKLVLFPGKDEDAHQPQVHGAHH